MRSVGDTLQYRQAIYYCLNGLKLLIVLAGRLVAGVSAEAYVAVKMGSKGGWIHSWAGSRWMMSAR